LHLFSHTQSEDVKRGPISGVTVAPPSWKNHGRASLRGRHANSPRRRREKEKRIAFLFRRQNRYYSAGPARVPTWKRVPWPP